MAYLQEHGNWFWLEEKEEDGKENEQEEEEFDLFGGDAQEAPEQKEAPKETQQN